MRARSPLGLGNVVYIEVTEDIAVFLPLLFLNRRTLKPTEVTVIYLLLFMEVHVINTCTRTCLSVSSLAGGGGSVIIT